MLCKNYITSLEMHHGVMEGVEVYNEKINEMKEFRDLFRL